MEQNWKVQQWGCLWLITAVPGSHCLIATLPQKYWKCLASFIFRLWSQFTRQTAWHLMRLHPSPSCTRSPPPVLVEQFGPDWISPAPECLSASALCLLNCLFSLFLLQSVAAITASRGAPAASALRPSGSIRHPCPGVAPRGWPSSTVPGEQAGLRPLIPSSFYTICI